MAYFAVCRGKRPVRDATGLIRAFWKSQSNVKAKTRATAKATHGILINVENYGFYQELKNYESNVGSNAGHHDTYAALT